MFEKIDRVAIAVNNLDEAMARFSKLFNTTFHELPPSPELGIRACYGPSGLELVQATNPDTELGRTIAAKGEGLWALVYRVSDMEAGVKHVKAQGMRQIGEIRVGKMHEVIFHPRDAHGVMIALAAYPDIHPATVAIKTGYKETGVYGL